MCVYTIYLFSDERKRGTCPSFVGAMDVFGISTALNVFIAGRRERRGFPLELADHLVVSPINQVNI